MLYARMTKAAEDRDADAWGALLHDDFEFVRHQSGTSMNKAETLVMMRQFLASDIMQEHSRRCLYESDDFLVVHSVMDFPDGTHEAVLAAYTKQDGLIIRSETGATPLKR